MAEAAPRKPLAVYFEPRILTMLVLGFSSGLPFLLVGGTLGYWLRDSGVSLKVIGFVGWATTVYSLKFLWAPLIDRINAPLFGRLGRRRGWMALAQVGVGCGLIAMALRGPGGGIGILVTLTLLTAFAAATQDIVIDAWRIETARDTDELGLLTSAETFGFRVALLATDALILFLADYAGWKISYLVYGAAMSIGLIATFIATEPARADAVMDEKERDEPLWTARGIFDAIAGPLIAFFKAHGVLAFLMLAAISLYRLPDFLMGPMAAPLYHDIGLTKTLVGAVRASIGLGASFAGIAAGGFCAVRFGFMRTMIAGGFLQAAAIAAYAVLTVSKTDATVFMAIMALDSFATSFAGVALVAYMSSLTSLGYTATQYALLSSAYALVGKIFKGFSGEAVEALSHAFGLMQAYAIFFVGCGLIGLPAIALLALLAAKQRASARLATPP